MEPSANEDMSNHEMALNRAAICVAQRVAVNGVTETYCGDAQQAEGRLLEMGAELILLKKKTERSKAAHAKLDSKLLLVEFEMAKIKESISASKVAVEDLTRCVVQAFDSKREVLNLAAAYYTRSEREGFTDEKVDKSIDIIEKITEDQYHTLLKARGLAEEALMTKRESLSLSEYENTAAKVKSSLKRKIAEVARHLGDEDCSLREQEKIRASIDEFNECSKCARGLEKMREIVRAKKMKADCKEDQSFECVVCYGPKKAGRGVRKGDIITFNRWVTADNLTLLEQELPAPATVQQAAAPQEAGPSTSTDAINGRGAPTLSAADKEELDWLGPRCELAAHERDRVVPQKRSASQRLGVAGTHKSAESKVSAQGRCNEFNQPDSQTLCVSLSDVRCNGCNKIIFNKHSTIKKHCGTPLHASNVVAFFARSVHDQTIANE